VVAPAIGAVVLVRFPFSDLSQSKLRPAVVLADAGRGDRILCQVTSKPYGDAGAIELGQSAFASGSLRVTSYARPGKLFTASRDLVTSQVAVLKPDTFKRIVEAVVNLLRGTATLREP
jgi:PemK-like, MazF-like toxin of type II toxin-antitoxin system